MFSSSNNSGVFFFWQQTKSSLQKRTTLKKFIKSIFKQEGIQVESLNYIFCTDKALLSINQQFLQHNYYTDIITFDLSDSAKIKGEIYISINRVRDNAKELGVSFTSELHRVIFHGALHLCGFNDKNKAQKAVMRSKEDQYLKKYLK